MRWLMLFVMGMVAMSTYAGKPIDNRLSAIPEWMQLGDYKERIQPVRLRNGSYVFINDDGTMNMMTVNGEPVPMDDGTGMKLLDGSVIMMKRDEIQFME